MIEQFKDYYFKAKKMQELKFQGGSWTEEDVNDDLVWNIPIYDVINRRFAAFSSFVEAVRKQEEDPKGNGKRFTHIKDRMKDADFIMLCYLFRLCGSGINYVPRPESISNPIGTHGFGNFWIVDLLMNRDFVESDSWVSNIPMSKFSDNKGYLLPMIPKGLRNFIIDDSTELVAYLISIMESASEPLGITDLVDLGNEWLMKRGFKRQNFVLTAFAMDMAEYFPRLVDQDSDVYVGSNAKKCLKLILPKEKPNAALRHLCDITGGHSKPYDMEDVACDFIRYIENFQSPHHIKFNNGIVYENNIQK